jgi:hypothetical protein
MAVGDEADVTGRVLSTIPADWFPPSSIDSSVTPIRDAIASGAGAVFSWIYSLIGYTRLQTRIGTATDGFLDIISQDFYGGTLPRLKSESDDTFRQRILGNLFLAANTRTAIANALAAVTGYPVRIIEPWQPSDNLVWNRGFWGVDTRFSPGQWSNGSARCVFLVQCALPPTFAPPGTARFGWNNGFWGVTVAGNGWYWNNVIAIDTPMKIVASTINKLRSVGIRVYLQFVSPAQLLGPDEFLSDQDLNPLTTETGQELSP